MYHKTMEASSSQTKGVYLDSWGLFLIFTKLHYPYRMPKILFFIGLVSDYVVSITDHNCFSYIPMQLAGLFALLTFSNRSFSLKNHSKPIGILREKNVELKLLHNALIENVFFWIEKRQSKLEVVKCALDGVKSIAGSIA